MVRWLWLGWAICCFTTTASAEEYVFRIDAIGYIDRPATEIAPTREILTTVEVISQPNVPFRVKAQFGKETVMFSGQLAPTNNGTVRSEIRYLCTRDTGLVIRKKNQIVPALDKRSFHTTIDFTLGKPVMFGGHITHRLVLTKLQPNDDREKPLTEERDHRLQDKPKIASGDEYLLRVDTVGYVDQPAAANDPEETTLRSIEVLAIPNAPFRAKVQLGKETMTFSGKLEPSENGTFSAAIRYAYTIDTGTRVLNAQKQVEPVLDGTSFRTIIGIAVGEPVMAGGVKTRASQPNTPTVKSKIMHRLVLTKSERPDDN